MAMTRDQTDGLWGDGGPYSQVQVIREVRILDESVSRTFFYVKANVNPTTYETLKPMETQIEDGAIRSFLDQAAFVSHEDGYEWHVYGQQAGTSRGATRAAELATEAIIRMHQMAMQALGLPIPREGDTAETPQGGPAGSGADMGSDRRGP